MALFCFQQVIIRNRHLKEQVDHIRQIMWDINTMLSMRKDWKAAIRSVHKLFLQEYNILSNDKGNRTRLKEIVNKDW